MPDRGDDDATIEGAADDGATIDGATVEAVSVDDTAAGDAAVDGAAGPDALTVEHEDSTSAAPAPAAEPESAEAEPPVADPELLAAVDLARAALREITPDDTVGEPAGSIVEGDRVLSLLFANTMPGYPGWYWTVTLARVEDAAPTVLEAELMPGEGALLSPEWLPWSARLAGVEAEQEAERLAAESDEDEDEDEDDDDDEDDEDDDVAEDAEDADDVLDGVDFEAVPAEHDDDDDDDTSFDGADR